jgi:hypothetical protein
MADQLHEDIEQIERRTKENGQKSTLYANGVERMSNKLRMGKKHTQKQRAAETRGWGKHQ